MIPVIFEHNIPPLFDSRSETLILGSFPSVKSREQAFYYGHPQNRFWRVLSVLLNSPLPVTVSEKKRMLLNNRIALWDVIAVCDVEGSSDSSIKNVTANDVAGLLANSNILRIFVNGGRAGELYDRYLLNITGIPAVVLPSTSPANAKFSLGALAEAWKPVVCDRAP